MKRVVTGYNEQGKSIFAKIDSPEPVLSVDTIHWQELWNAYPDDRLPIDPPLGPARENVRDSVFPSVGKSIFRLLEFYPGVTLDPTKITGEKRIEISNLLPGLFDHIETDDPGMHTTDSIDYGVIISGSITLELDDGESVKLEAGDVFIQNGTRHAWRVDEKCVMAVVLIGVERRSLKGL